MGGWKTKYEVSNVKIHDGLGAEHTFLNAIPCSSSLWFKGQICACAVNWPPSFWRNNMATKLYVGNLPETAKEKDLRDLFQSFGDVSEVAVLRGYGFVVSLAHL